MNLLYYSSQTIKNNSEGVVMCRFITTSHLSDSTAKAPSQIVLLLSLVLCLPTFAQDNVNYDWLHYGNDLGHSKYAPLDQINASNVINLEIN